jgi:4-amino-4-deoxy-L-arabinose transferase-like glycosyltransferase
LTTETNNPRYGLAALGRASRFDALSKRTGLTHRQLCLVAVSLITLMAAVVRFSTLGLQSFWNDEAVVGILARSQHNQMLSSASMHETTPPTYYLLVWIWARLFGTTEIALRSLSALAGTAIVPIAYWGAELLSTRRAALVCSALAAVNPLLIWYSQESRPYALLATLAGLSFVLFVRALRSPTPGWLGAWSIVCSMALCVHYFAVFIVLAEAIWLIGRARGQLGMVLLAVFTPLATLLVLSPSAMVQRGNGGTGWIAGTTPLWHRLAEVPKQFLTGFYQSPTERVASAAALVLVAIAVIALVRRRRDRALAETVALGGTVGLAVIIVPMALSVAGVDLILTRNLLAAWVPLAIVVATALARFRRSFTLVLVGALCVISLALVVSVDLNPQYQRSDWRGISAMLGKPRTDRAVIVTDTLSQGLGYYRRSLKGMPSEGALLSEIDVVRGVGPLRTSCWWGTTCYVPTFPEPVVTTPPGFTQTQTTSTGGLKVTRFQAPHPVYVDSSMLFGQGSAQGTVLVEQPAQPK